MSHPESAIAGFYDHEQESTTGRGRRDAPDWGGDDLFTGTPRRRRFERSGRGDHLGARLRDTTEHPVQRRAAARPRPPFAGAAADAAQRRDLAELADRLAPAPPDSAHPAELVRAAPDAGRRTVTVTGHPDGKVVRRRPAPTMDERLIGSRPERIAAYAFGLGLLLILIAILTAHS